MVPCPTFALVALLLAAPQDEPALRGLDPVLLCDGEEFPGREDLEVTRGRYTYRFADEETRDLFLEDPERWGIQWGGGCGRMGPLSGVGSPDRWVVQEGRIYIFASDGCREGFLSAPERFVVPPPKHPPLDEEKARSGRAWIARAVEAHGGAGAIDSFGALRLEFEGTQSEWKHRLDQVVARDGSLTRHSSWTPPDPDEEGFATTWTLAEAAYVDEGEARFELTSSAQLADLRRFAHREPLALLWARTSPDFAALYLGRGNLGDRLVENVLVLCAGLATTLHLDPATGRILGLSWRGRPGDGVTRDVVEVFTDWRETEGVSIPVGRTVTADEEPKPSLAVAWATVELLAEAPEDPNR